MTFISLIRFGGGLILLSLLIVPAAMINSIATPPRFAARADLQVIFPEPATARYDASALNLLTGTQVELVKSTPVKGRVIEKLNLQHRWGERYRSDKTPLTFDEALMILSSILRVDAVPETSGLMTIQVHTLDREEAAEIANTIAAAYIEMAQSQPQQGEVREVRLVNLASPPMFPFEPNYTRNILTGLACAAAVFFTGVILAQRGVRQRAALDPHAVPHPDLLERMAIAVASHVLSPLVEKNRQDSFPPRPPA